MFVDRITSDTALSHPTLYGNNDNNHFVVSSTAMLAKGEAGHNKRLLPESFTPGPYDVIFGRGRKVFMHEGNQRFRTVVADSLQEYSDTTTKMEKSYLLCDIVAKVRNNSPNGGFVKKDPKNGRWHEVGDFLAREKTSQAFRDALHDQYKSSNTAKKMRRLQGTESSSSSENLQRRAFSSTPCLESTKRKSQAKSTQLFSYQDPLLSMRKNNQTLARSVIDFGQGRNVSSLGQEQQELERSITLESVVPVVQQSCPNFMQSSQAAAAFHNYEWAGKHPKESINNVDDNDESESSMLHMFDLEPLPEHKRQQRSLSMAAALSPVQQQPTSSMEDRLLALRQATMAMGGFASAPFAATAPETDMYDRLVHLVGNVPQEGDPFEPEPVVIPARVNSYEPYPSQEV
jgi:hypothetical protein